MMWKLTKNNTEVIEILFAKTCYYKNQNEVEFNALSTYQRNVTYPEIRLAIHESLRTNAI
jgi:hypothetical protein